MDLARRRWQHTGVFRFFIRLSVLCCLATLASPAGARAQWAACFTPAEDCEARIIETIGHARKTIRAQAYSFTSAPIATALVGAVRRGVDVRLIVGHARENSSGHTRVDHVATQGVVVLVDSPKGLMHDKIIIIDNETVVTGSYNFSASAAHRNVENVLIVNETNVARRYGEHWRDRAAVSLPYEARTEH